ncbi:MAG: sugar ABC transporter permease [Streptococcaceae bacterium]|jgi:ABC-type sugar transport system permease subunit|nr:sugar ABC transporter permease [Streptococcaceae bacterium]
MRKLFQSRHIENTGYLFVLPWIIGFLIFTAYPIFYSLYLSFYKVQIGNNGIVTTWIGLQNYVQAFTGDIDFISELGTYLQQIFIFSLLIVILALLIAMMLNQKIRGISIFRTIFFLPVIIVSGPVLQKLEDLGMTKITGQTQQTAVTGIFGILLSFVMNNLVILLWFTGVPILIFLAALQKQDINIFEAARIDGAGAWEVFWKITLPGLSSMILVNMVYVIVSYSTAGTNPIIGTISKNMFAQTTGLGYSASLAWIFFVLVATTIGLMAGIVHLFEKRSR